MPFLSPYDVTDAVRVTLNKWFMDALAHIVDDSVYGMEFRTIEWGQEGPDPHKVGLEIGGKHFTLTLTEGKPKL